MWDELNRILGGNRKDGLPAGKELQQRRAPLPENTPVTPADVSALESKNETPPSNDGQVGEFENLSSPGDLVDESDWRNILDEASGLVPPAADEVEDLPRPGAGSAAQDMAPPRSRFLVFTTAMLETSKPAAGEAGLEQGADA